MFHKTNTTGTKKWYDDKYDANKKILIYGMLNIGRLQRIWIKGNDKAKIAAKGRI